MAATPGGWKQPAPLTLEALEPVAIVTTLTRAEQDELGRCEETIRAGWQGFVAVGEALLKIQEAKLFRDRYEHFEDYYQEVWQYQKSQVYRLMDAAKVVRVLSPIGEEAATGVPMPTCEAQVRPLANLGVAQIKSVWRQAAEEAQAKHQPITARLVQSQVRAVVPPTTKPSVHASPRASQNQPDHVVKIQKALDELVSMIDGDKGRRHRAEQLQLQIMRLLPR